MRIGKFALVGASGILVNELFLWLFTDIAGFYFLVSSVIAIEIAIITNFIFNNFWTFSDRRGGWKKKFVKFNAVSLVGMVFNVILLYTFTTFFGIYYLISNVIAIFIVFAWNYFANRKWTFRLTKKKLAPVGKNPLISIVIPTYNERENIETLIPEIFLTFSGNNIKGEVIIVDDDSPDGTWKVAEKMEKMYKLKVIRRKNKRGLGSAVVDGLKHAKGDVIGVMDADLSHPPEKIPELVKEIIKGNGMAVGSRKIGEGRTEEWPLTRKVISWGAGLLARPLVSVKDPMSGFFFFNKNVIKGTELNPTGYKIGLEIMVKGNPSSIKEIPFVFRDRKFGESKLTLFEDIRYLYHLIKLYWFKINR